MRYSVLKTSYLSLHVERGAAVEATRHEKTVVDSKLHRELLQSSVFVTRLKSLRIKIVIDNWNSISEKYHPLHTDSPLIYRLLINFVTFGQP